MYTNLIKIRKRLPLQKNYLLNDVIPSEVELAVKLKSYPHKYILSIDEIYLEEDGIYLIMDHCQGGTLFKYFCN
jgi:serine/threonine protein kinase